MAVTLNASTTTGLEIASDTSGIVTLRNNGTDALSVNSGNLQFNSGYGSVATAYGCRAWVNFNGTGTVAIRASGNVSSITDNGVGDYTVNFTNALPDANYSVQGSSRRGDTDNNSQVYLPLSGTYTASSVRIFTGATSLASTGIDSDIVNILVVR
jgi:hypothetical protein